MAMRLSKAGLNFIKSFEGCVLYVYDDKKAPVKGKYREWKGEPVRGTLTIGYGHTNAAKHPLKITQGLKISEKEAAEILDVDLDECEQQVNTYVKVPLTQGQFDALCSFNFNCGPGNLKKLIAPLNKGDYDGTRAKFDLYNKSRGGNGKLEYMRGLARRRDGEQALWDSHPVALPEPKEVVEHPAEVEGPPADQPVLLPEPKSVPKTAAKSTSVWAGIVAIFWLVWGYIYNGLGQLFNLMLGFLDWAPETPAALSPAIMQTQEFTAWLGIPWDKVSALVVVLFILVMIARHVRDVRWLNKA